MGSRWPIARKTRWLLDSHPYPSRYLSIGSADWKTKQGPFSPLFSLAGENEPSTSFEHVYTVKSGLENVTDLQRWNGEHFPLWGLWWAGSADIWRLSLLHIRRLLFYTYLIHFYRHFVNLTYVIILLYFHDDLHICMVGIFHETVENEGLGLLASCINYILQSSSAFECSSSSTP